MSIRIDQKKCVGCRKCSEVCPGTLIVMEDKKAVMKYPKNCWGCVSCVKECKAGAIDFFLGADIGGNGSIMNVKSEGDILHWIITKTDGSTSVIDVDRRNCWRCMRRKVEVAKAHEAHCVRHGDAACLRFRQHALCQ